MRKNTKNSKLKIAVSILLSIILLFVIGASFLLIIKEQNHHCCGQDCPICQEIMICQNILHSISDSSLSIAICAFYFVAFTVLIKGYDANQNQNTLVSLKVKLSN